MTVWTVVALLGLAVAGVSGSAGLLEVLGLESDKLITLAGLTVSSVDQASPDQPQPCGVSPSAAVTEAAKACEAELQEDQGQGRGRRRRGKRGKRADEAAIQRCVFEKLELVADDGTPSLDDIKALIKTYSGEDSDKQIMSRMTELCMGNIGSVPADKKVGVLMTCVKSSMKAACAVRDLEKQNPSLALMVAQEATEKCMEGVELPPELVLSGVSCSAQAVQKLADARLQALAPSRKRRSPNGGKGGARKTEKGNNGGKGGAEVSSSQSSEEKDDDDEGEDDKEKTDGKTGGSRADRRQKRKEARKRMQEAELQITKERLEKVTGPLEDALKDAGDSILTTARCTHQATGVLDGDKLDADKLKTLMSQVTGSEKTRAALLSAVDACLASDTDPDAFTKCIYNELSVTCPAASAADKQNKRRNAAGGGRRRPPPRAGRPPKVGRPKVPAALRLPA